VVAVTLRPLHPRHALDWRAGGHQRRSGCCAEDKNLLPLPGLTPRPYSLLLQRLSYPGIIIVGVIKCVAHFPAVDLLCRYETTKFVFLVYVELSAPELATFFSIQ
jgi:hypothetical protein